MTCRLDEMNSTDALYAIARKYPGGIEALAKRMGKSAGMLYKKLERGSDQHHLRDDEFDEIVALCAAARVPDAYLPLRAKAWRHGHVAVKLPDLDSKSSSELAEMVVRVFKEGGDVARIIDEKTQDDGRITRQELPDVEREIEQAIGALAELRERARRDAGVAAGDVVSAVSLRKPA